MKRTRQGTLPFGVPPAAPTPAPASTTPAPSAPSAFDVMMRASRAPTLHEAFNVNRDPLSGVWSWSWTPGNPPAGPWSWARTTSLKLGGAASRPHEVHMCTNEPSAAASAVSAADPSCRLSPSVLKSGLQKAIRRGLAAEAVAIASELWCRSPVDALRRVLVIIIEDALLHPAYPLLTFFLLATSIGGGGGYVLGPSHASAYLTIVSQCASTTWRDALTHTATHTPLLAGITPPPPPPQDVELVISDAGGDAGGVAPPWAHPPRVLHRIRTKEASASRGAGARDGETVTYEDDDSVMLSAVDMDALAMPASALVRSLLARALFGGMGEDVLMLRRSAFAWARRFAADVIVGGSHVTVGAGAGAGAGGGALSWLAPFAFPTQTLALVGGGSRPMGATSWFSFIELAVASPMGGATPPAVGSSLTGPFLVLAPPAPPRLRLRDMPLSAIDQHCSEIVTELVAQGKDRSSSIGDALERLCAAMEEARGATHSHPHAAVSTNIESVMWTLRSSINARAHVPTPSHAWRGGVWVPPQETVPRSVRTAWAAVEEHADAWARSYLEQRIGGR